MHKATAVPAFLADIVGRPMADANPEWAANAKNADDRAGRKARKDGKCLQRRQQEAARWMTPRLGQGKVLGSSTYVGAGGTKGTGKRGGSTPMAQALVDGAKVRDGIADRAYIAALIELGQ